MSVERQSAVSLEPQGFMLVSSKECRVHALECVRLAQTSALAQGRKAFAELARIWLRLAFVFQQTQLGQTIKHEPERRTDRQITGRVASEAPKRRGWGDRCS